MNYNTVNDNLFDAIFRQAVIDNYEDELNAIPSEKELASEYLFTPFHVARMKKLFKAAERNKKSRAAAKWARRSAAAIIIAISVLFGALMMVPEVKAAVTGVIIEWFDQFTKFTGGQDDPAKAEAWEPSYIPDGFAETARYGDFGRLTIRYSDSDGIELVFTYIPASDSASTDNEDRVYSQIESEGITYHIFEAEALDKNNAVIWDEEGYRFIVEGGLPIKELMKIAKAI